MSVLGHWSGGFIAAFVVGVGGGTVVGVVVL